MCHDDSPLGESRGAVFAASDVVRIYFSAKVSQVTVNYAEFSGKAIRHKNGKRLFERTRSFFHCSRADGEKTY
jgi:hypothetical protein